MHHKSRQRAPLLLLTNHLDAWGLTFVIVTLFFVIHDAFTPPNIGLLLAITAMYWLGFAVNDYYDQPYDSVNQEKTERNAFAQDDHLASRFMVLAGIVTVLG